MNEHCSIVLRWGAVILLAGAVLCHPARAKAETAEQRRSSAEVLFNDAGQLFRDGKYAEACAKLANSQRLDPAVGTLLNLGRCYEKIGRTASAWLAFVDAAAAAKSAGQTEREAAARAAAGRLAPSTPKLSIQVSEAAAVSGLAIHLDGESIPPALWNIALPTDPGEHKIELTAPGKKPWLTRLRLSAAEKASVNVPVLADDPSQAHAAKPSGPGAHQNTVHVGLGRQRTIALVLGGVGVVGAGVGSVFGLLARSDASKADHSCAGSTCADQAGLTANESAHQKATLSTIFFGAGIAALGAGAALWLTAPSNKPDESGSSAGLAVAPVLVGDTRGLLLQGRW